MTSRLVAAIRTTSETGCNHSFFVHHLVEGVVNKDEMANVIYLTGVLHPNRCVRVLCMGMMYHACVLRSLLLFRGELCMCAVGLWLLHSSCGLQPLVVLGLLMLGVQTWCWLEAAKRQEYIAGHRAGAKGYTGVYVENTTEAMMALIERDNGPEGPVPDLHYVEIDVQETADGELIILHDFHLGDAFPNTGPNVEPYSMLRTQLHLDQDTVGHLHVRDVTLAQLHSLHLGGRQGLRAPTLASFMRAFRAAGCRRPVVVEIKRLQTDAARERLLLLLREHLPYAQQQQAMYPQFAAPRLGFLAIIAFPHYYAASLGELGSRQWAHWGTRLATLGIPVRCCFLDCLSFTRGLQSTS